MKRRYLLINFYLLILFCSSSINLFFAQKITKEGDYHITDDNAQEYEVEVFYSRSESCNKVVLKKNIIQFDSLKITGPSYGLSEGYVIQNKFLIITIHQREGYGASHKVTMVLSVLNKRLHENLVITTFGRSSQPDVYLFTPESLRSNILRSSFDIEYDLELSLKKSDSKPNDGVPIYDCTLNESLFVSYSYDVDKIPTQNKVSGNIWPLEYDRENNIYYNGSILLNGRYSLSGMEEDRNSELILTQKMVKGVFLSEDNYVYLNMNWYKLSLKDSILSNPTYGSPRAMSNKADEFYEQIK